MSGSQMKTEHSLIARSVNTFIPLGDERMDTQPHPFLHFVFRMNPTSTNVFLQVIKNVEVTRGMISALRRVQKCFPAKFLNLNPHQIGVIMQKDDSAPQHSRAFWLYGASQHPQPPRNETHLSAFLCLPPFPMLDEHTLHYAHLQSNKETTMRTRAFLLCMSPTLQMALSIRNNSVASFCEECVLWRVFVFIWLLLTLSGAVRCKRRRWTVALLNNITSELDFLLLL